MNITKKVNIQKKVDEKIFDTEDDVIVEYKINIIINGKKFVSIMCTPKSIKELAYGFLFSENIINSKDDIQSVEIDGNDVKVTLKENDTYSFKEDYLIAKKTITTACGNVRTISYPPPPLEVNKIQSSERYDEQYLSDLMSQFNKGAELFLTTGGVHSCALADKNGIQIVEEDIGRHNALDKIIGHCLLNGISLENKILLTSGRISSEMALKVIKIKIPFLVSRSAPTDKAIEYVKQYNLKLYGFVRGRKMNIYS